MKYKGKYNLCALWPGILLSLILALSLLNRVWGQNPLRKDIFLEVVVEDRCFAASDTHPVIRVHTREPVALDAMVYDMHGRLAATFCSDAPADRHVLAFTNLPPVDDGRYYYWLTAENQQGERIGIYPKDPEGGEIIKVDSPELDAEASSIIYTLPRFSLVRIRAGLRDGPFLAPVLPWTAQLAGRHEVHWSGVGGNNLFDNLLEHPGLHVLVSAITLPINTLVAETSERQLESTGLWTAPELPRRLADMTVPPWPKDRSAQHTRMGFPLSDDFVLLLEVESHKDPGFVDIRVDAPSSERARILNNRFEIMLFVDGVFLMEDEMALLPFNYSVPTEGLSAGRHILTVNVVDSDGQIGALSKVFEVTQGSES